MKRKSESKGLYAEQMVRVGLLSSNWAHERPNIKEIEFTAKHVGRVEIALYNGLNIYDLYRLPSGMYLVRTEFITTDETRAVITEPINVHKLQADFPELATETNLIPRVVLDEEGNEQQNIAEEKISDGIFDVFLCHNSTSKAFVKEIGIQLKNEQGEMIFDLKGEDLATFPKEDIANKYVTKVKPGKHSLIIPLGAKAILNIDLINYHLQKNTSYILTLTDISGTEWTSKVTN